MLNRINAFKKSYIKDTGGNIAAIFAVSALVLLAGVGVAVDFSMVHRNEVKLQNAADAAVLAAAKTGKNDQAQLLSIAKEVVNTHENFDNPVNTNLVITPNGRVQVRAKTVYNTFIMRVFGRKAVNIGVMSEAPLTSSEPVNIALVLDTTGSMKGAKLASLKTASNNLINQLESYQNSSLKVSVVPFGQYVNVGKHNRNAVWIDVPADSSSTGKPNCGWKRKVIGYKNCRIINSTCYNDGTPYSCSWKKCDKIYGPKEWKCSTPTYKSQWHGCVGSRQAPWHERVAYNGKKIPGLMNTWCGAPLRPLTNDMAAVKATINSMSAHGYTYIPSGLLWGWRTLDSNIPFTQASGAFANNTQKVMILMSDGANTRSRNGKFHTGNNIADANNGMRNLCNKIKNDQIEIYTIAYDISDAATKNRMRNCATDASMYFDASNAAELNKAFEKIGANLARLRLTH